MRMSYIVFPPATGSPLPPPYKDHCSLNWKGKETAYAKKKERKEAKIRAKYVREKWSIDQCRRMSTKLPEVMGNLMIGYLRN